MGRIRFYFAKSNAKFLPFPTIFWPYSQALEFSNSAGPGEITGPGLRRYDKGQNRYDLPGDHYEGTPADFLGDGIPPSA